MGVPTSSRRYLWCRHLDSKMAAPEMTSTKTWGAVFDPHCGGGGKWWPFRFRPPSWMTSFAEPERGHSRWRPEEEGPPFSSTSTIGIEKRALYYSQLKHNSRKRADKKGGRKRPRINDEISVILPAPDASFFDNSIAEIPQLDTSHRSDISGLVSNHFSTKKTPGILIHQKTSDEINMNQS